MTDEDDKVSLVLNHTEGAAAERLFNCGREWRIVNYIFEVYGQGASVWVV